MGCVFYGRNSTKAGPGDGPQALDLVGLQRENAGRSKARYDAGLTAIEGCDGAAAELQSYARKMRGP